MLTALKTWPSRRWVAVLVATPLVTTLLLSAAQVPLDATSAAWLAMVAVASLIGGTILASYVSVVGRGIEVGCSPCAVMSGLTVVGGTMAMHNWGPAVVGPMLAAAVMLFGLTQRLSQPATCAAR